ncbi:MAG: hypothetical protein QNK05_21580 [Myxococcota bacterium]|nr:hypothetical protein [Myxococcota bacterium]
MSNRTVLVAVVAALVGLGAGHQIWGARPAAYPAPNLPSPRSKPVDEGFAPIGVEGEIREILLEPDTLARTEALARRLSELGPESLEPVRAAYEDVLLDQGDTELVLFGEWWGSFDPNAALRWTQHHWNTDEQVPVLRGVMRAWGRSDPITAITTAGAVAPNDVQRLLWVDYVLRGWDESVIDGATSYALSLGAGPQRQWALTVTIRRRVMRDGPESVIAWAEALPEDDEALKLNAYRRVAAAVAEVDVDLAAAFAERHMDGPYGRGLPHRVGATWIKSDPEAAMRWLAAMPASENRNTGVMEAYRAWLARDRKAAQAYVPATPHDGWLDPAVALYARSISLRDPHGALEWASGIRDVDLREGTMGNIARKWYMRDQGAAEAWLAQSDLPPDLIRKIKIVHTNKRAREAAEAQGRL